MKILGINGSHGETETQAPCWISLWKRFGITNGKRKNHLESSSTDIWDLNAASTSSCLPAAPDGSHSSPDIKAQ